MNDPSPAPAPVIDLGQLLAALQQLDPANWIPAAVQALANLAYAAARALLLALWNATLLGMPHELTDQFAPVRAMMPDPTVIAGSGLALALVLLGLRTILQGLPGRTSTGPIDELLGRVTVYAAALSMLPWIIEHAIDLEQALARSVAATGFASTLPESLGATSAANGLALLLVLLLGVRLWFKLASNIVHVAVAIVWAPVALVCGLMPQTAWVADLWIREFAGRLAGAVLASIAVSVGLALALAQGANLVTITGAGGAFLAAYNLTDWLARTPSSSIGNIGPFGPRFTATAIHSATSGGAHAAAIPANQLTTLAERFGYD